MFSANHFIEIWKVLERIHDFSAPTAFFLSHLKKNIKIVAIDAQQ